MAGFQQATGKQLFTIPLAADKFTMLKGKNQPQFVSDLAYIGTNLPAKRKFFRQVIFPLRSMYKTKFYGQDWTYLNQLLGLGQKVGQYFNLDFLKTIRKPNLQLSDEADIYHSAKICLNVHESYQVEFGGDCNERTFKIPLAGGFELVDDVACIRRYFIPDKEIIIARDKKDWQEKIAYYLTHPQEKKQIIAARKKRVLRDHTYHNRVKLIIDLYRQNKKSGK
jgi:spore maturation protein CgeB